MQPPQPTSPAERVFDPGDVLVTEMTTPDWEPMMKESSLVVTERGGRTSHAAIVAREFGIPAIVGCEGAFIESDELAEALVPFEESLRGEDPHECEALRFVRQEIGLDNLQLMIPFCRSPEEGREVIRLLDGFGLSPEAGVPLFLMVELPSNVLDAQRFIEAMSLTGGSIGSNDLVQTVYAVSRDDLEHYAHPADARSPAVKSMIRMSMDEFTGHGLEIGICGQAPSDHPEEVPPFLVSCGITSISVTPATLIRVRMAVAQAESGRAGPPPDLPA